MTAGVPAGTQARKLGLKPEQRVCIDQGPDGWAFDAPPAGLIAVPAPEPADLIISFFRAAAELPQRLPDLAERIYPDGALWVAWPRRAAGHASDITDNAVRECALPLGIVDVKVAALDQDWSALKLVWRLENRSTRRTGRHA